ncbi:hypothetical protein HZH66_012680 [Vespula vulgaris]|uniref:Uncharacterized protein n=1 Tax=Vespula vulgaris TaxID=7454 RepID=A0A834JAG1_VESVU|nr:hypothetical protein HZH66_012680 [Vespula vulgaris]
MNEKNPVATPHIANLKLYNTKVGWVNMDLPFLFALCQRAECGHGSISDFAYSAVVLVSGLQVCTAKQVPVGITKLRQAT